MFCGFGGLVPLRARHGASRRVAASALDLPTRLVAKVNVLKSDTRDGSLN